MEDDVGEEYHHYVCERHSCRERIEKALRCCAYGAACGMLVDDEEQEEQRQSEMVGYDERHHNICEGEEEDGEQRGCPSSCSYCTYEYAAHEQGRAIAAAE